LRTLLKAAQAAGLVDELTGGGPFTVFAPTDEAFAKLPKGTLDTLLKPENKAMLAGILTYHVVPGKVKAKQVTKLSGATTLNGQRVDIAVSEGAVTIDNATVTQTDIKCSNGVIHVIDTVLMPEKQVALAPQGRPVVGFYLGDVDEVLTAQLGLDAHAATRAISLAVSMAAGAKVQFGTPAKPFHAGMAAKNAVLAATLAAAGLDASAEAIEGARGFTALYAGRPEADWQALLDEVRAAPAIERHGLAPKIHPCCGSAHRVLDAVIALRGQHGFDAADVVRVDAVQLQAAHLFPGVELRHAPGLRPPGRPP